MWPWQNETPGTPLLALLKNGELMARRKLFYGWVFVSVVLSSSLLVGQSPPPGFWRGQGSTDRTSDLQWVNLLIHYDSEFTFSTDREGKISGKATVRYTLRVDDGRLRALLAQYNGVVSLPLGMVPAAGGVSLGTFLGVGAKYADLQGVSGSYDGGTVVRQEPIKGQLKGNELHLEWATVPEKMPYKTYRVYATRREVLGSGEGPAYSPWSEDAVVSQPSPGHWEAALPASAMMKKSGKTSWTTAWSAHQEAPTGAK
jgi:hypothetical protein